MSGTTIGGQRAAAKNIEKYGSDFYAKLGRLGGSKHHPSTRYFSVNREAARESGRKGGTISRRRPKNKEA